MNCLTGFFYGLSIVALAASPLGDEELDFAAAVDKTPVDQQALAKLPYPAGFVTSSMEHLRREAKVNPASRGMITAIEVLMAIHPSPEVKTKGQKLADEIRIQVDQVEQDFLTKVNTAIDHAREAVKKATQPSDLDSALAELAACTWPGTTPSPQPPRTPGMFPNPPPNPMEQMMERQRILASGITPAAQDAQNRATFMRSFVDDWQDYLNATASGNTAQARSDIQSILSDSNLTALNLIPRSQLIALQSGVSATPAAPGTSPPGRDQLNKLTDAGFKRIKTVDDVAPVLADLGRIPQHYDYSILWALDEARNNLEKGMPATIDFEKAMVGPVVGDDVSRVVNMELLAILPYYLDIQKPNPPRPHETTDGYLNRLMSEAEATGDLLLFQRALAVRVSLACGQDPSQEQTYRPAQALLGALSEDAEGQIAAAVFSYETALRDFDPLVPIHLVGHRLAALKATHPHEFEQGFDQFMAQTQPGNGRFSKGFVHNYAPQTIEILPISSSLSVQGQKSSAPKALSK